jgi:hypothetical protein
MSDLDAIAAELAAAKTAYENQMVRSVATDPKARIEQEKDLMLAAARLTAARRARDAWLQTEATTAPRAPEEKAMTEPLGDAPVEDRYRVTMNAVARVLDEAFNGDAKGKDRKVGFCLMVFPFGEHDARTNFISNGADRKDIVTLFREMIARFTGQPGTEGHA